MLRPRSNRRRHTLLEKLAISDNNLRRNLNCTLKAPADSVKGVRPRLTRFPLPSSELIMDVVTFPSANGGVCFILNIHPFARRFWKYEWFIPSSNNRHSISA